jgi:NAD-dependent deacetylase
VFAWYLWRWRAIRDAVPHAGYQALVALEQRCDRMTVVTQNVDGLHARAGTRAVIELHGSLTAFRCVDGGHPYDQRHLEALPGAGAEEIEPPRCARCGSPIRPGVVWFGEPLPWERLEAARTEVETCDALLVVGTAALVYPAADLAWAGVARGIPVIEINPQPTPLSSQVALAWRAGAGVALPRLASALRAALPTS